MRRTKYKRQEVGWKTEKYQEKDDYFKQKITIVRKKSTRSEVDCSDTMP
jgi:hypothetical protein